MAGYAYPVGVSNADTGTAKTVTVNIDEANTAITIFTAVKKTKVNSILVTNISGGILPTNIILNQGVADLKIASVRALTTQYVVLPLVSADTRTADNADKTLTEFTLQVGDILKATCPVAEAVNVTLNLTEGVK